MQPTISAGGCRCLREDRGTPKVLHVVRIGRNEPTHPRTPIMRRLHADRGDNPDPGIGQSTCSKKIVDER